MKTPPRPLPTPSSPFLLINHPLNARHVLEVPPIHTSHQVWPKGVVCGRLEGDWSVAASLEGAGLVHRPPSSLSSPPRHNPSLAPKPRRGRGWDLPLPSPSLSLVDQDPGSGGRASRSTLTGSNFHLRPLARGKPYTDPSSSPRFSFAFHLCRSVSRTFPRRRPDTVPRDLRLRSAFVDVPLGRGCLLNPP